MDITAAAWSWRDAFRIAALSNTNYCFRTPPNRLALSSPIRSYPFRRIPTAARSKKRDSRAEAKPVLKPSIVDEVLIDDEDDDLPLFDELEDEGSVDDNNFFEDVYSMEDAELYVGDGEGGGGISLARLAWDKEALAIAKEVVLSFNGELKIYAFRTLPNCTIRVRIEKLSNNSGSPSMADIEAFSLVYRKRLDDAELSGSIPKDITLEVSSPGVERVVRVPEELDRFKERPMYVRYVSEDAAAGSSTENDGVFKLVSLDMETNCCIWALADVKVNRQNARKGGQPLNKKQREWRLNTPFDSLRLVRFHSDM